MKLFRLLLFLTFGAVAFAQSTPYDCFSAYSFTGTGSQTGQANSSSSAPCVAWRVTYTSTGFSSVTVKFQTSPDNANWTDVVNTICSSSVQPPCVTDGANPLADGVMGSSSFRAYGKYVRVSVTGVTGTGSGQVVVYGYKGTSASAGLGGGGGGPGATGATGPAGATGATGPAGATGAGGNPGTPLGSAQFNVASALAGQAFALNGGSHTGVQRAEECVYDSFNLTGLTANATTQEVTIIPSGLTGDFVPTKVWVQESTQAAFSSTLTVSMGRTGGGTNQEWIPNFTLKVAGGQNYWMDIPGAAVMGVGNTYTAIVLGFTGGAVLNSTVTGIVKWGICGFLSGQ